MRLHLTCILLIAVISMRGDALENGATVTSAKDASVRNVSMPPEPVNPASTEGTTTAEASTAEPVTSTVEPITTNATTAAPTTNGTTITPAPTESTTTTIVTTSTTAVPNSTNTTTGNPTSSTPVTTVIPKSSTSSAATTERPDTSTPAPSKDRHFDGLSFMGGIILACCLVTIGAFSWKFYKVRQDRNYRTL